MKEKGTGRMPGNDSEKAGNDNEKVGNGSEKAGNKEVAP